MSPCDHPAPSSLLRCLAGAGAAFAICAAGASTFRVDDSGTVVSSPVPLMRWRQLVPGRARDNTVETTIRVDVRLDLARWVNQPCRIFLALAPTRETPIRARWTTQGRLLPGALTSGDRTLVFEGRAGPAVLAESLSMTLEADGSRLSQIQTLQFQFEIEVTP